MTIDRERLRDAIQEAEPLDLPDGAYWEWLAERIGLEPGDGYEVAAAVAADPEFYGWEVVERGS